MERILEDMRAGEDTHESGGKLEGVGNLNAGGLQFLYRCHSAEDVDRDCEGKSHV